MKSHNLTISHPDLLKEWHPSRNGNLSPINFSYGSHKKVWWQCLKCNAEWDARIFNRTIHGHGCPYCSGKRVSERNCLVVQFPDLVSEWHDEKNGTLKPNDVSYGSNKKVWWQCIKCDSEWEAYIYNRTKDGHGCPYCSGHRVSKRNSLAINYPDLAKEWDYEKNVDLNLEDISFGSSKKVGWICSECGHKWSCVISDRIRRGTRCPICTGRETSKENPSKYCLALACPDKAKEWHPTKNGKLTPWDVTIKTVKKAWWICNVFDEEYEAIIRNRARPGRQCPVCNNKLVTRENSLGALYPVYKEEWDFQKNIESPYEVAPGTPKLYFWKCKKGHSWEASPNNRTSHKSECPYCSGRLASEEWNLEVIFPDIAKELHPSKNVSLNPYKISPYSNERLWWLCKKGHEWEDTVNHRTASGRGCPHCYSQTSASELRIYTELKWIFGEGAKHRHKIFDKECDIFVPHYKLVIEYDGYPWHQDKEQSDSNKESILADKNIELIRVRDKRLKRLKEEDLLIPSEIKSVSIIKDILSAIKKKVLLDKEHLQKIDIYLSFSSFQNEPEFNFLMSQRKTALPGRSFAEKSPDAAAEWDYERNGDLGPEDVPYGSALKAYFKCKNKGHVTYSRIVNRSKGHSCIECVKENRGKVANEKSFGTLFPNKAAYWDYEKNTEFTPYEIAPTSCREIWLTCPKGHSWRTKPKNLTSRDDFSPPRCKKCRKPQR